MADEVTSKLRAVPNAASRSGVRRVPAAEAETPAAREHDDSSQILAEALGEVTKGSAVEKALMMLLNEQLHARTPNEPPPPPFTPAAINRLIATAVVVLGFVGPIVSELASSIAAIFSPNQEVVEAVTSMRAEVSTLTSAFAEEQELTRDLAAWMVDFGIAQSARSGVAPPDIPPSLGLAAAEARVTKP